LTKPTQWDIFNTDKEENIMAKSVEDFIEDINDRVEQYVDRYCDKVTPEQLGLDRRAGYKLWVSNDHTHIISTKDGVRVLNYYGGFEYVDTNYVSELGDYVFYSAEDSRVGDHISRLDPVSDEEEEEEEEGDVKE
jgi:hypothetical protein